MKAQAYLDMMKRQQQELTDFPIAYAFNEKQLEEALEKLGATKEECCTYLNMGDVMKKTDVPAFKAMLKRHTEELQNAMKNEQFAEEAFRYEMDNHEYAINWSGDDDVLAALCLDKQMVKDFCLEDAYHRAVDLEKVDFNKVLAEAKSKGYKYSKNAIHSNDYLMKYNDSYFRIGLVDITYGVLDEGEKINVFEGEDAIRILYRKLITKKKLEG